MRIKKTNGRIFGASLTAAEKKAMHLEIQKELAEYDRRHVLEIDAMILWVLREQFGFGPKRLRQFYDSFNPSLEALIERYELEDSDQVWLCTQKLKDFGIDVEQWYRETM